MWESPEFMELRSFTQSRRYCRWLKKTWKRRGYKNKLMILINLLVCRDLISSSFCRCWYHKWLMISWTFIYSYYSTVFVERGLKKWVCITNLIFNAKLIGKCICSMTILYKMSYFSPFSDTEFWLLENYTYFECFFTRFIWQIHIKWKIL